MLGVTGSLCQAGLARPEDSVEGLTAHVGDCLAGIHVTILLAVSDDARRRQNVSVPSASFALQSLAERLGHRFERGSQSSRCARVGQYGDHLVCEVLDGADAWGVVTIAGCDDEFSSAEIEAVITRVVTYVTDNLWPDQLTDPWPRCPAHSDHPPATGDGLATEHRGGACETPGRSCQSAS